MAAEKLGHEGSIRKATKPGQLMDVATVGFRLEEADFRQKLGHLLLMILPVAFGLVMWFFTAPDPRYLGSITWLLPLAASLALISDISLSATRFRRVRFLRQLLCSRHVAL